MTRRSAANIWLTCGACLAYFVFNAWSAAFKWPIKLPGLAFGDWDPYAVALVSVPVALIGIIVQCLVGSLHARKSGDARISRRLPKPFALDDQDSPLLHAAQLFAFLGFPIAGTAVLFVKFTSGTFCRQVAERSAQACGKSHYEVVGTDHFAYVPFSQVWPQRAFIYEGGADYWPFWQPMIFVALAVGAAIALGAFVHALLTPRLRA